MMKRIGRLFKDETKQIIKKFENPINVLKHAKEDLFNKAVECEKRHLEIDKKLDKIKDEKSKKKLTELSTKLHNQAKVYKARFEECDDKTEELLARKLAAETTLEIMRDTNGLLSGDSPLASLAELENDIANIETEVDALINVTEM